MFGTETFSIFFSLFPNSFLFRPKLKQPSNNNETINMKKAHKKRSKKREKVWRDKKKSEIGIMLYISL